MVALRNRLMQRWPVFDAIAFEHSDSVKVLGEHPRGHQSREATTDDDSMLPKAIFHDAPPSVSVRNGLTVSYVVQMTLANEEAEDQAVEALWLVELHPMAGAFEALVAPHSRDAGGGAQHLRFCKVRIPTAPNAQGGGWHVR